MTTTTTDYISTLSLNVMIAGIIAILITLFTGIYNRGSLIGTMLGYSLVVISIVFLVAIQSNKPGATASSMLFTSGPFLIMIASIIYLLYLLGKYFDDITSGHVSQYYSTFSTLFLVFTLMQVWLYSNNKNDSKAINMVMYLLGIINIIFALTLGTILAYFSTDG
jgi:hypothetical protein